MTNQDKERDGSSKQRSRKQPHDAAGQRSGPTGLDELGDIGQQVGAGQGDGRQHDQAGGHGGQQGVDRVPDIDRKGGEPGGGGKRT